jgi:hypothetical protein
MATDDSLRESRLREMCQYLYRLALDERFTGSVTLHFDLGLLRDDEQNRKRNWDLKDGRRTA